MYIITNLGAYRTHVELQNLIHKGGQFDEQHVPAEIAAEMGNQDRYERFGTKYLQPWNLQ